MCLSCVQRGYISKALFDIIDAFVLRYPGTESGLAHIVLADCNIEDYHVNFCLSLEELGEPERGFLRWLLTVPEDLR